MRKKSIWSTLTVLCAVLSGPVCAQTETSDEWQQGFDAFSQFITDQGSGNRSDFAASGLNPPLDPAKWVALGDSFAAGPGAGDTVQDDQPQCMRGTAAYAFQMQNDPNMPHPPGADKPEFVYKFCTGDVTTDLTNPDNPNYQLAPISEFVDFVTLSIGGNDILFSTILKKCVYGLPPTGPGCDEVIENSRKILYGKDFNVNYNKVISQILDKMHWKTRHQPKTSIFQTGYSQFFDAWTDQCDEVGFLLVSPLGPKILKELRTKLNELTHEVNFVIQYWIDLVNSPNTVSDNFQYFTVPINFINADRYYNYHRFCREGVTEPDAVNIDTHFFHLAGNPHEMTTEEVLATMDKYDAPNSDSDAASRPVWMMKAFHPTDRGMGFTAEIARVRLQWQEVARYLALSRRAVKIMVLGDYLAYARQDPNSDIFQGFMPHLQAVFRDYRYYGWPMPGMPRFYFDFIGSRRPYSGNGFRHEIYQDAMIDDLREHYEASPDREVQGKVVIIMAGMNDMLYDQDSNNAAFRIADLVKSVFASDKDALVLLAQLPLPGTPERADGTTWPGLYRRIIDFNARLSVLVNEFVTKKAGKIRIVHTSTTPLEHRDGDPLLPDRGGYRRMAYDFAEALVEANLESLLPEGMQPANDPGDQAAYDKTDEIQCVAPRGFITGQPSKEDLRASYLGDMTVEDWAEGVACNKTAVCKISADGLHGDPLQIEALSLNATMCFHAGGKPGVPDYNELNVTMPSVDYNLEESACRDTVKSIIETCIDSDKASGGWWKSSKDGLFILLGPKKVPGNSNEVQDFEANYIKNEDVMALITADTPLPPRNTPPPSSSVKSPDPTPTPSGTPTPTPTPFTDFNCNCGESGCTPESAPCCANGSCQCHCGESGCAAEDPSCCANGTCQM